MTPLTNLAHLALLKAKRQSSTDLSQDVAEQAWFIYLKITRQSPGCTKKDFFNWLYEEYSLKSFVKI